MTAARFVKRLFVDEYDWCRPWVWVAGIALFLAALTGGGVALNRHANVVSCRNTARAMHREYRSGWLEGCLVQLDDGSFIPLGNLRTTDVERAK